MSDKEKDFHASPADKPKYVYTEYVTRHVCTNIYSFSFYSGLIIEDNDSKSDDKNETKKKSRAAGPLEIVRACIKCIYAAEGAGTWSRPQPTPLAVAAAAVCDIDQRIYSICIS